ncbi:glycoside hydrolase family 16 protein [Catalinimonas niigatensis]|uniref:glycoside hydrolase family 16 protein n=1 Tax=Catalinimonas niigatensis TaxID=1397264 RepID=UPI002664F200|nr:glycoside hydrolase family 16 protein [Catalinimonas niigatensis]WPP53003.1 glycoside hydrolase family 16 protein [Catalinimonas niigatensis]
MNKYLIVHLITILFIFVQCAEAQEEMQLVWSDEFEENDMPDPQKWAYDTGGHGWGNNELQYYTEADPDNVQVKEGKLIITARKENFQDNTYTSAKLVTRDRADWRYGRIEVSARLPEGKGTWPAIWMLPDVEKLNWPRDGEIDIMEHVGFDPGVVHGTVHTEAYNHRKGTQVGKQIQVPDFNKAFHVYAIKWTPEKIDWFLDGELYHTFENEGNEAAWPFDKPFYLILNLAVGGDWGGAQGIDENIWPQSMEVDYVRVYQMEN